MLPAESLYTNSYFKDQHQATRDGQPENLGVDMPLQQKQWLQRQPQHSQGVVPLRAGGAASSASQGGGETLTSHYSLSKSQPPQIQNDSFSHIQQFNTVDNRQIGQVPPSQLQR